jgi:uncharacterized protein YcbK (DUF882 family)
MKNNMISQYISYTEATISQTAVRNKIDNTPNKEELDAMKHVASQVFDKVREHFGKPLKVSSFFRCSKLNKAVGGSSTSQHMKGEAIDIQGLSGIKNSEIFDYIKNNLEYDQLIWEFGNSKEPAWVHVSLKLKGKNRKQILHIS